MKTRILHFLNSNQYSGAENIAINIIKNTSDSYDSVYCSPQGPINERLQSEGIEYIAFKKLNYSNMFRICKTNRSILHLHDFRATLLGSLIPRMMTLKKISHVHQNPAWLKKKGIKRMIFLFSCFFVDEIVFVSQQILVEANLPKSMLERARVLNNVIDSGQVLKGAQQYKSTPSDLIFVGRLETEKNPVKFIEIVNEIRKYLPVNAIIVGDGSLRDRCKRKIVEYNLNDWIEMVGNVNNPFAYMLNSRILLNTSNYEGFGLTVLEALILGKPVIVNPVGGLNDIVNTNVGSFCDTVEEFSKAVLDLLQDGEIYQQKSKNAVDRAKEINNEDEFRRKLSELYG